MRIVILILTLLIGTATYACEKCNQEEDRDHQTLFGNKRGFGGYLGINSKSMEINGQPAMFMGGELNMVIGHSLNLGFEGYGMLTHVNSDNLNSQGHPYFLQMGYGGFHIEPVIASDNLIHLTLPVLLGAGGIAETQNPLWTGNVVDGVHTDFHQRIHRSDMFLIAEPGINLELNVSRFMRLAGGVSYKFVSDAQMPGIAVNDLEGISGNLSLRFGWF